MSGHYIHLVGSVPLGSVTEVFETLSDALGPRLLRIPDGEIGSRLQWINGLEYLFSQNRDFEPTDEIYKRSNTAASDWRRYRLKNPLAPEDYCFDRLQDANTAIASYREFARLKQAGKVPAHCRFQIQLIPAHSVIRRFVVEAQQLALERRYDEALCCEIDKIAAAIPHDQLAIQWDVASAVFERLERGEPTRYGKNREEMQVYFSRHMIELGNHVPADIDLVFHLCYGDSKQRHTIEPESMAVLVEFANHVSQGIARPIQLFHMPVPINRSDDEYFAPLENLKLRRETKVSLGLVHSTDGVSGTRKRMAVAAKFLPDFLIATECGFGRRPPESIPDLLRIHSEAAAIA